MRRKKVCAHCGSSGFGLIRYRSWYKTYCSKKCRATYERLLIEEMKRRKQFLQFLAQG